MTSLLTDDEARDLLGQHFDALARCIAIGFDRCQSELATAPPTSPRSRACLVHDFAADRAEALFDEVSGVKIVRHPDDSFRALVFEDRAIVRFKKLDADLKIRAIPTGQAQLWDAQQPLDDFPDATNLIAGYQLNDLGQLASSMLVCSKNKTVLWAIDLEEAEGGMGSVAKLPLEPQNGPSVEDRIIVRSERESSAGHSEQE